MEKKPDGMSEEELARFFEEHEDDDALWESKPRKIRVRRGSASTTFSLRLAPEELLALQAAAAKADTSIGDFIRRAAMAAVESNDLSAKEQTEKVIDLHVLISEADARRLLGRRVVTGRPV